MTGTGRGVGRLIAATGVSMVGQGAVLSAVPLLAATLTRDPVAVSVVSAAPYGAWLVIGLVAGALVDRWPLIRTMIGADLFRALVLGALSAAILAGVASLPLLVAAVFLIAVAGCFFDPAAQAAIPTLTSRDGQALAVANSRLWSLDVLGRSLLGPPLGAALFAAAAVAPFGLNAVTFVISGALLLGIHRAGHHAPSSPPVPIHTAVKAGLVFLAGSRPLRLLVAGMGAYNFAYNLAAATLVLFAQDYLHLDARGFGLLLATLAVGGLAGGALAPRINEHLSAPAVYAVGLAVQGAGWATVALVQIPVVSGIALALVGLASTVVSVVGGTARQLLTPDGLLGRVSAATRVVGIGAAALG
ncbi:MAG: MFS transporter, partial [Dermatophilaceae bacterium]